MTDNTNKSVDLIGRQVYFKLSKAILDESSILDLTPGKMYTIIDNVYDYYSIHLIPCILDDAGCKINIIFAPFTSAHLCELTHWILRKVDKRGKL